MEYLGNKDILHLSKTGFLCSQKIPADIVIKEAIEENRLLVICPFDQVVKRVSRESAGVRNKYIVEICDRIQVGYKTEDGQLDKILNNIPHDEL